MTAAVVVRVEPGKLIPGGELRSTYTDGWANTKEELLASYRKWSSAEIISFEIVNE